MRQRGTVWGIEAYRDFTKAAYAVGKLSKEQLERIVDKLHDFGHTFSQDALRQHVQKMIRDDRRGAAGAAGTTSAASSPGGPSGPSGATASSSRASGARRPAASGRSSAAAAYTASARSAPSASEHYTTDESSPTAGLRPASGVSAKARGKRKAQMFDDDYEEEERKPAVKRARTKKPKGPVPSNHVGGEPLNSDTSQTTVADSEVPWWDCLEPSQLMLDPTTMYRDENLAYTEDISQKLKYEV
ncbi:hypothetical protein GGR54DRAFT_35257 [Hypoxylon sp. NC1633]|nr:hypothetical protein GGR54DRAFT_35257 [Hypoxylon sp. NC1633]